MSRFAWLDCGDHDDLAYGRWVARVRKVLHGKPAREALKDLERALLSLPKPELIEGTL